MHPNVILCHAPNGVTYLRAPFLPCPHGFSTRVGGISTIPANASLNLTLHGDPPEVFEENLRRFATAVGFDPATILGVTQTHSAEVMTVTKEDIGLGYTRPADFSVDGYVTAEHGVTIGIRTADCVPILAAAVNAAGEVTVIGAFHAGWRGTVKGIAEVGIRKMVALGADVKDIRVAMGPAIHRECFEIHEKEYQTFLELQGAERVGHTVTADKNNADVYYADLYALNREILLSAGILPEHIAECNLCTACHPELFFSHRVTGYDRGSLLSVICMK